MTKQEVIADAQKYANQAKRCIYVWRRGNVYQASANQKPGWKLAETVFPQVNSNLSSIP